MTELAFGGRQHLVLINGWNGTVASDIPDQSERSGGLMEWLGELLDD
jgi:hypothetical protein